MEIFSNHKGKCKNKFSISQVTVLSDRLKFARNMVDPISSKYKDILDSRNCTCKCCHNILLLDHRDYTKCVFLGGKIIKKIISQPKNNETEWRYFKCLKIFELY